MISIVVPCFNEEESLPFFYKEYRKIVGKMTYESFELVLVDDGSKDKTLSVLRSFAENDSTVKYLSFSRNFGKESAIYAGIEHSVGDYVVMMDADLQDPPALLPEMYKAVTEEGYDSAATRRATRKGEPPLRSFFARRFYSIMNKISRTDIVDGARDYRLMNRKFVAALLKMKEYNRFSKGLFGWVGFKTKWIEYENVERIAGKTKWSFWNLFIYAIDGVVAFSTLPLQVSAVVGLITSAGAFSALALIVVRRLLFDEPVAGWASTVSIILFSGGVQLLFIGVLGLYLAKIYSEVKARPLYIIKETNLNEQ